MSFSVPPFLSTVWCTYKSKLSFSCTIPAPCPRLSCDGSQKTRPVRVLWRVLRLMLYLPRTTTSSAAIFSLDTRKAPRDDAPTPPFTTRKRPFGRAHAVASMPHLHRPSIACTSRHIAAAYYCLAATNARNSREYGIAYNIFSRAELNMIAEPHPRGVTTASIDRSCHQLTRCCMR